MNENQTQPFKMKWYNFQVKFMMMLDGVSYIIVGLIAVSTIMYAFPVAEEFEEYVYSGSKIFDIVCGVIFVLLGAAQFYVRSHMKKFRSGALKKYYALIISEHALFYVYDIVFPFVTHQPLDIVDTVVFSLATLVVRCALEIYYFNKRKVLFVN